MVSYFGFSIGVFALAAVLAGSGVRIVLILPRYHRLDVAHDPALGINEGMDADLSAALSGARIHQRTVQQLNLVNDKTIVRTRLSAGERRPEPDPGPVPQDSLRSPVPNTGTLAMENHDVIPQGSR